MKQILVPTDFSGESAKALRYALPLARCYGAGITLLHVIEPHGCPADYGYGPVTRAPCDKPILQRAATRLKAFAKKHIGQTHLAGMAVRQGVAFDEITRAARHLNSDFIIMSTRGAASPDRDSAESTSERVVRHAPCPVMIVREREHEFV